MAKIYVKRSKPLNLVALNGTAQPLEKAIEEYSRNGKLRQDVEFGPIFKEGISLPHNLISSARISGNIYTLRISLLNVCSYNYPNENYYWINCLGEDYDSTFNFVKDFVNGARINVVEPRQALIKAANQYHQGIEDLWPLIESSPKEEQRRFLSEIIQTDCFKQYPTLSQIEEKNRRN